MHAVLIHNPTAGTGSHAAEAVKGLLREAGYSVTECSTKDPRYKEALRRPTDLVLVAGGDGTVTRVVRGLRRENARLAILPLGTANNIARSLGIEGDAEAILHCVTGNKTKPLDVGIVSGPWGSRRFVEAVGVGLLADWMQGVSNKPAAHERTKLGRESLKKVLADYSPRRWSVTIDGEEIVREALSLQIMNGRFVGPALSIGPLSEPGDHMLDVMYLPPENRQLMLDWLDNPERSGSPFVVRQGRKVALEWDGGALHIDDKAYAPNPAPVLIKAKIKPMGVQVCTPSPN
jgi:diacylglycerol kinase (ATP)